MVGDKFRGLVRGSEVIELEVEVEAGGEEDRDSLRADHFPEDAFGWD